MNIDIDTRREQLQSSLRLLDIHHALKAHDKPQELLPRNGPVLNKPTLRKKPQTSMRGHSGVWCRNVHMNFDFTLLPI